MNLEQQFLSENDRDVVCAFFESETCNIYDEVNGNPTLLGFLGILTPDQIARYLVSDMGTLVSFMKFIDTLDLVENKYIQNDQVQKLILKLRTAYVIVNDLF